MVALSYLVNVTSQKTGTVEIVNLGRLSDVYSTARSYSDSSSDLEYLQGPKKLIKTQCRTIKALLDTARLK